MGHFRCKALVLDARTASNNKGSLQMQSVSVRCKTLAQVLALTSSLSATIQLCTRFVKQEKFVTKFLFTRPLRKDRLTQIERLGLKLQRHKGGFLKIWFLFLCLNSFSPKIFEILKNFQINRPGLGSCRITAKLFRYDSDTNVIVALALILYLWPTTLKKILVNWGCWTTSTALRIFAPSARSYPM